MNSFLDQEMNQLEAIEFINLCSRSFYQRETPFILKKASYEKEFVDHLSSEVILEESRYHDVKYKSLSIEVKKGQGAFWIPEVRMAEMITTMNDVKNHWTLFIRFSKPKKIITHLGLIPTFDLIEDMNITQEWAELIIARDQKMKQRQRTIHCQQSYSWSALVQLPRLLTLKLEQ